MIFVQYTAGQIFGSLIMKLNWCLCVLVIPVFAVADSTFTDIPDYLIHDDESAAEYFQELLNSPINLNDATSADLQIFPFLSEMHIEQLTGALPLLYLRDVRKILGKDIYDLFRPFFYLGRPEQWFKWEFITRAAIIVQQNNGLVKNIYPGSPLDLFTRIKLSLGKNITAGILIQKDAGEKNIYDHLSGFLSWSGFSDHLQLIAGDFVIHAGHGLVYSSPYGIQKSALAVSALKVQNTFIRPYLTTNESGGFQGLCLRLRFDDNFSVLAFYSGALRDATLNSQSAVTGIAVSGLHRTTGENTGKDCLQEICQGFVAEYYPSSQIKTGITWLKTVYSPSLVPVYLNSDDNEKRKNFFRFYGSHIQLASAFWSYKSNLVTFSGEMATNRINSVAAHLTGGLTLNNWQIGFRWWHLPKDFQSPQGRTFSSQSMFPAAEQGCYLAVSGNILPDLRFDLYWNPVKQLWRSYFIPLPVNRDDWLCNIQYNLSPNTRLTLRWQNQIRELYESKNTSFYTTKKIRIRLQIDQRLSTKIMLRSRFCHTQANAKPWAASEKGMSVFQEIRWKLLNMFQFIMRYTSFHSAEYDTRIFEVEHDVAGSSDLSSFWGNGYRWYVIIKADLFAGGRLSFKYRRLYLDNMQSMGSGYDTIESNLREDLKLQIEFKN